MAMFYYISWSMLITNGKRAVFDNALYKKKDCDDLFVPKGGALLTYCTKPKLSSMAINRRTGLVEWDRQALQLSLIFWYNFFLCQRRECFYFL